MDFKAPDDWAPMVDDDAPRNPAWLSRYELHGVPLGSDSATALRPVAPVRPRAAAILSRQASAQLQSRAAVVPAPAWVSSARPLPRRPTFASAPTPAPKRTKKTASIRTASVGPVETPLLVVAIHDSDGEVSYYRPTPGQQLFLIFNSHAIGKRVPVDSLAFFLDGSRIEGDQTPEDLGLEPGDRIDCVRG